MENIETPVSPLPSYQGRTLTRISKRGELKIAEVSSRFTDVGDFQNLVSSIGFRLRLKVWIFLMPFSLNLDTMFQNNDNTHFTLFEFTKLPRKGKAEKEWTKILSKAGTLKPCEYKRR